MVVRVNGTQIGGSPFQVLAKIHPTQLDEPVWVVKGVDKPGGLSFNSKQQLIVAELDGKKLSVFDRDNKKVETITCEKFSRPTGVAVDKDDNIYVYDMNNSSLLKFNKEGKLVKVVGRKGTRLGESIELGLIKIFNDTLYVCDSGNHRVQILNTELEYMDSFGCRSDGDGQFNEPNDIAQDGAGNLYMTDTKSCHVQVFERFEQFLSTFIKKKGTASKQLDCPCGICVGPDQFVYVCDNKNKCVSVFNTSGDFVTSFGQFSSPAGIVIDDDGFVYVSDCYVSKVYIM